MSEPMTSRSRKTHKGVAMNFKPTIDDLLRDYGPGPGLVARGVMADPEIPDEEA